MIRVWATDGSGVSQPIEKTVKTEDDSEFNVKLYNYFTEGMYMLHYLISSYYLRYSNTITTSLNLVLYSVSSSPRLLRITRDIGNEVELNWLPPVNPNGVINSYVIEYTTNSTFTTISGTVLTQNS